MHEKQFITRREGVELANAKGIPLSIGRVNKDFDGWHRSATRRPLRPDVPVSPGRIFEVRSRTGSEERARGRRLNEIGPQVGSRFFSFGVVAGCERTPLPRQTSVADSIPVHSTTNAVACGARRNISPCPIATFEPKNKRLGRSHEPQEA